MDVQHELIFQLSGDLARQELERSLQTYLEREANRPDGPRTSVFARCEAQTGCWILSFDTRAALEAFHSQCRLVARSVRVSSGSADE
jgi:hypothetical protein